jgi:hypothetical protein
MMAMSAHGDEKNRAAGSLTVCAIVRRLHVYPGGGNHRCRVLNQREVGHFSR